MKKMILSVAMATLALGFTNAQKTKFGVKGGLNVANLIGDVENASSKVGIHLGGFVEFKISEKFAIQPELLFSMQGAKQGGNVYYNGVNISVNQKINLSYLNIPIMAKYYVAKKFNLELGPQIGFLLSGKVKATATANGNSASDNVDLKDYIKSVDFGLAAGLGYDFTEHISGGVRYNFGLSDLNKAVSGSSNVTTTRNSVFQLSVGYKF